VDAPRNQPRPRELKRRVLVQLQEPADQFLAAQPRNLLAVRFRRVRKHVSTESVAGLAGDCFLPSRSPRRETHRFHLCNAWQGMAWPPGAAPGHRRTVSPRCQIPSLRLNLQLASTNGPIGRSATGKVPIGDHPGLFDTHPGSVSGSKDGLRQHQRALSVRLGKSCPARPLDPWPSL
jgi:hypothetical protein